MARTAYVNGRYVGIKEPAVRIEDRGYQFADGVYEVIKVVGGELRDLDRHMARLERSLGELRIEPPVSRRALGAVIRETLRRNGLKNAIVYVQVSRGTAPRNHLFPRAPRANLVVTVRRAPFPSAAELQDGCAVITVADQRWGRCDIKSISLLANVLAKQQAAEAGCREAWQIDEKGMVREGSASNAWIVDMQGRLITHPLGPEILGGITRARVIEMAKEEGVEVIERPFTLDEALEAREAFLTSTSSLVMPVVEIDGRSVANGKPGSVTMALQNRYRAAQGMIAKSAVT